MNVTVKHTISMGHRLQSYKGICSSPHGHNVTVEVHCNADEREFLDFKLVSTHLKGLLSDFDHAMVLEESDPVVDLFIPFKFRVVVLSHEPTTENIAVYIYLAMRKILPEVSAVRVFETEKYSAFISGREASLPDVRRVD